MLQENLELQDGKTDIDRLEEDVNNCINIDKFGYEDKKDFILQQMNDYLLAVEQNQPKTHKFTDQDEYEKNKSEYTYKSGPKKGKFKSSRHRNEFEKKHNWTHSSTLAEWLQAVSDEIDLKLEQIRGKIKNYSSIGITPVQRQLIEPFVGELKYRPEEEQKFDKVVYEWLEWYLPKCKETINEFLTGTFQFKEEEFIKQQSKKEIADIVMKSMDKKQQIIDQATIINQNKNGKIQQRN